MKTENVLHTLPQYKVSGVFHIYFKCLSFQNFIYVFQNIIALNNKFNSFGFNKMYFSFENSQQLNDRIAHVGNIMQMVAVKSMSLVRLKKKFVINKLAFEKDILNMHSRKFYLTCGVCS